MKLKMLTLCSSALAIAAFVAPAAAAPLSFTFTGTKTGSFVLDSNPTPDTFSSSTLIGDQIGFNGVPGVFNGNPGFADISFGTNLVATLNILNADLGFTQLIGPALFSGPASTPTFATGTFVLNNPFLGDRITLEIAPLVGAVPEPGTWAMLILGFGLAGASMRYGRRTTSVTFG